MFELQNSLLEYTCSSEKEQQYKLQMLDLLRNKGELAFSRNSTDAHFTASAWLINKSTRTILLIKHNKLQRWLQPGGHADGEPNLEKVARKEVFEETNLQDLSFFQKGIFDIDIHLIPENKNVSAHYHHDVRYAYLVENTVNTQINNESTAFKWLKIEEIKELTDNTSILRMVRKTEKIFKKE